MPSVCLRCFVFISLNFMNHLWCYYKDYPINMSSIMVLKVSLSISYVKKYKKPYYRACVLWYDKSMRFFSCSCKWTEGFRSCGKIWFSENWPSTNVMNCDGKAFSSNQRKFSEMLSDHEKMAVKSFPHEINNEPPKSASDCWSVRSFI